MQVRAGHVAGGRRTCVQLAVLLVTRVLHRQSHEATTEAEERDRLATRMLAAHQWERDRHSVFAGQLGATLPLAGTLAGDRSTGRPTLSARETEVPVEWFQSESKDFVGQRLGISPRTVSTHLEHIRVKYAMSGRQAPTKAALLARAIQDGLVQLDDL